MKKVSLSIRKRYKAHVGVFYKFLSLDSAIKTLESGTLKYSNSKIFNDPLDGHEAILTFNFLDEINFPQLVDFMFQVNETDVDEMKKMIEVLKVQIQKAKENDPGFIHNLNIFMNKLFQTNIKDILGKKKICCFTKHYNTPESTLMWSHYARNHEGICLGFDNRKLSGDEITDFIPLKVKYHSNLFVSIDQFEESIGYYLLNKLDIWKYEKEVRILIDSNTNDEMEFLSFPKDALVKVVFGFNTNKEIISKIRDLLINKYEMANITFEKMALKTNPLSLKSYPFDIGSMKIEFEDIDRRIMNKFSSYLMGLGNDDDK